jgi:hypothetical protein
MNRLEIDTIVVDFILFCFSFCEKKCQSPGDWQWCFIYFLYAMNWSLFTTFKKERRFVAVNITAASFVEDELLENVQIAIASAPINCFIYWYPVEIMIE